MPLMRSEQPQQPRADAIVVAHCTSPSANLGLSWLQRTVREECRESRRPCPRIAVYQKCARCPAKLDDMGTCRELPNVGREAHTYLTYIAENYDALPENIVFTLSSVLHQTSANGTRLSSFRNAVQRRGADYACGACEQEPCAGHTKHVGSAALAAWLAIANFTLPAYESRRLLPAPERPFAKWYETNVHAPYAEDAGTSWAGCPNGIFTVSRRAVHRRSRQEWERLLEHNYPMAKEERRHAHQDVKSESEVAHFFERAWGGLFAGARAVYSSVSQ